MRNQRIRFIPNVFSGRPFLLLMILLSSGTSISFAQSATFEAYADARQVVLNGYFNITFTLKNGDGENFKAPSFKDFVVAGGPNRSMSTTLINGAMSREISYSYTLRPRNQGKFTIESATIVVGGKEMRTNPLTIEVVEGKASEESNRRLFVRAELSIQEAWVGQQIILDYKLYTTIDVESYNILEESEYQGFYAEDVRRFDARVMREVIDGVQYTTKILKRTVLFPQKTGILEIDPMAIQMGIAVERSGRSNSFFFNRQIQRLDVFTDKQEITVKALPQPAPVGFTGAVGKFDFRIGTNIKDASTDDAISLKVEITGDGDIKRVGAPQMDFPETFEVYDPKIIEESITESAGILVSRKVFEYFLLPGVAGNYSLQPQFSYFDVESGTYTSIDMKPVNFDIRAGSTKPVVIQNAQGGSDQTTRKDINFLHLDTHLSPVGQYFPGSASFWLLFALPFAGVATAFVVSRKQQQLMQEDPGLRKSRKARKIALKRLEKARILLDKQDSRQFYDELSKALLGYIGDKLSIPLSELSKDNIREKITSLSLDQALVEQVVEVIKTCEFALFAGKDKVGDMQSIYEFTLQIITAIEDAAA